MQTHWYWPCPSIRFAEVGEDVVVLDISADSYSCIVGGAGMLNIGNDGRLRIPDRSAAHALEGIGWIQATPSRPHPKAERPTAAVAAGPGRAHLPSLAGVLVSSWRANLAFRSASLPDLLDPSAHSAAMVDPRVFALSRHFLTNRPWAIHDGACLHRAYSLRRYLRARGFSATWVFGVRTWPFAAHCWLQAGPTVLGDDLDRVRLYTPILVA